MEEKTIAAIATAHGQGGIGIIRVSGEKSIEIVEKIFVSSSGVPLAKMPGYNAKFGKIIFNNQELDEVVILVFRAPHSYTGENIVEICCHGGLYITKKILEVVIFSGAALAEPGEFTKRAFLNGKISLTQAESVMDIISAKGEQAARSAIGLKNGHLNSKIEKIKKRLINLAAKLSVWADYPDEDIPVINVNEVKSVINQIKSDFENMLVDYDKGRILKNGIDTAIIGKPNVGKSTLMNLLAGYERSIVTDVAGTTRDIVEETISLGEILLNVCDTAGIRQTNDLVESLGINKSREKLIAADLVLALFEGSNPLSKEDIEIIEKAPENQTIAIINKCDLPAKIEIERLRKKFRYVVEISAFENKGIKDLKETIENFVGLSKIEPGTVFLANQRQKQNILKALQNINEAQNAIDLGLTLDAITVSLEESIDSLLELTGEKASLKIVDEVFSKFCVGK